MSKEKMAGTIYETYPWKQPFWYITIIIVKMISENIGISKPYYFFAMLINQNSHFAFPYIVVAMATHSD